MQELKYRVELICDREDDFLSGSATVGLGHRHSDGTIDLMLRALPTNGSRLRLCPLLETSNKLLAEAAAEYREARRRRETRA